MGRLVTVTAPQMLVGTEVADVVAGQKGDSVAAGPVVELGQHRHELKELVGLQEQVRMVDSIAHRHRELKLPLPDSGAYQVLEQFRQLGGRLWPDLRIRARPQASRLRTPQRQEPELE
jgi:hypothetical protein